MIKPKAPCPYCGRIPRGKKCERPRCVRRRREERVAAHSFMQVETTNRKRWILFEDRHGEASWVPWSEFYDMPDGRVVEDVMGYGVRMAAPGYLDASEWEVYQTPDDALDAASRMLEELDDSLGEEED